MQKVAAFLLVLLSGGPAYAATYLCVAEAGAVVEDSQGSITAGLANVSQRKYVLTDETKKWVLKELGMDAPLFDKCPTPYLCERSDGYAGTFLRNQSTGVFTIVWFTQHKGANQIVVAKGKCSKL